MVGGSGDSNTEIPEPDLPTSIEDVTEIQDETVTVEDEYGNKVTIPKGFEVVEEEGTTAVSYTHLKYKELNLKDKLPVMSDDEKIELLSTDGMLIKRPILVLENKVLIGFKEEEWKAEM